MLAKHVIYLLEAVEGAMTTMNSIKEHHERYMQVSTPKLGAENQTQTGFRYQKILLASTGLRLKSLERRSNNIINLVCYCNAQCVEGRWDNLIF